jgi:hypothetical protein
MNSSRKVISEDYASFSPLFSGKKWLPNGEFGERTLAYNSLFCESLGSDIQ